MTTPRSIRVNADLLVPGKGEPIADGVLISEGDRIVYAGPRSSAPATPELEAIHAPVVMPGLWECHGHLIGLPPGNSFDLAKSATEPTAVRAARCVRDIHAALDAGVTSIRDVGGLGIHLAKAVDEGTLRGPAIYGAGAVLSTTGGHGDLHGLPLPWVTDYGHSGGDFRQCDGPAECAKAVREQLRKNAKLIKVCASGGVLSEVDHPIHQQFTAEELRTIVEIAGMADRAVAAHCHGKPGIMAAIEAGVRTIEHGTFLDEESCAAMRETGTILVPTRLVVHNLLNTPALPPFIRDTTMRIADRHAEAIALAHSSGVRLAMGTDTALSTPGVGGAWGGNAGELPLLVGLGLSPLEAIEAATASGPATLGPQAPRSGVLTVGYDADFITIAGNPVTDISVLADPSRITGVWKSGTRVKA